MYLRILLFPYWLIYLSIYLFIFIQFQKKNIYIYIILAAYLESIISASKASSGVGEKTFT